MGPLVSTAEFGALFTALALAVAASTGTAFADQGEASPPAEAEQPGVVPSLEPTPAPPPPAPAAPTPATETTAPVATAAPSPVPSPPAMGEVEPRATAADSPAAAVVQTPTPEPGEEEGTPPPSQPPPPDAQTCSEGGPDCGLTHEACGILGTPFDDVLDGSPFDDVICGFGGDDRLTGYGGKDILVGGAGDDDLAGGGGEDCLLAGPGDDEIRDEQPAEPVAGEPRHRQPQALVTPDGRCYRVTRGAGRPSVELVAGPVAGPTQGGAFFIALVRLATARTDDQDTDFPVTLSRTTIVEDGELRQFLLCPDRVRGRLVYRTRSKRGKGRLVARQQFTCTPPSEVVRIPVADAIRPRLDAVDRLRVTVRVTAGSDVRSLPVTLRVA